MSEPDFTDADDNAVGAASLDDAASTHSLPWTLRLFQPIRLAKLACLVGLSVFIPYLIPHLPHLASRPEYRIETKNIRVIPEIQRPIPEDFVEQVRQRNQLPRELSLLDPEICKTLGEAFSNHPWVAQVISVKQSFPSDIVVELKFRRPVAMVQVKGGRIPIDGSGFVLPGDDFTVADVSQFPTIRMVGAGNLTREGGRINQSGLIGAGRVAELLAPSWSQLQLEAIELPRVAAGVDPADMQLQLYSKSGSTIIWGRAPGSDHPGELTPSQKVARLEKYLGEFGGFDRPNGPYEIDIRHWQEITRRSLNKTQASRPEKRSR